MLQIKNGDLVASLYQHQAVLHGVNCRGVAGSGVALALKQALPYAFESYFAACRAGLKPGNIALWDQGRPWVIHAATQDGYGRTGVHARPEWIDQALEKALQALNRAGITDLALPKIGAGIGGLDWATQVEPIVRARLAPWKGQATVYNLAGP